LTSAVLAAVLGALGCNASASAAEDVDNVAVIVIDNFQVVPAVPVEFGQSANCPYQPEDVNVIGDQGAGDDLPPGVAHGKVVYSLLARQLTNTAGMVPMIPRPKAEYGVDQPGIMDVTAWSYHDSEVVLVGMDHDRSTTGDIAWRLRSLAESLQLSKVGFDRIVLNMSFVIAPCNVPQWLDGMGRFDVDATLDAYQKLIDGQPGLAMFQAALDDLVADVPGRRDRILRADPTDGLAVIRRRVAVSEFYGEIVKQNPTAVRDRIDNDPLRYVLLEQMNTAGRRVIPVGAAGNGVLLAASRAEPLRRIRFTFPFAPAIWNSVVSASASGTKGLMTTYSNYGEVLLDGRELVGSTQVQGTSFAAPRLSARQAAYLLTGGVADCNGNLPTLGYANSDAVTTSWNNLNINTAITVHCPDFIARPPVP
jgi:hypothetical protein